MKKILTLILILTLYSEIAASEDKILMETSRGKVVIELFKDVAPKHVERIKTLSRQGLYNGVVFHRVIDGFMAQTGDVKFGNSSSKDFNLRRAGMGGSDLPDLKQEFNNLPHDRGVVSMARSSDPNSANSQFFIMFAPAPYLDRNYTVFGKVIQGMDIVDKIKRVSSHNNHKIFVGTDSFRCGDIYVYTTAICLICKGHQNHCRYFYKKLIKVYKYM